MCYLMTVDQFLTKIERLIFKFKPEDAPDDDMYIRYEYDSDTHWIRIGIPPEWFDHDSDCDCEDCCKGCPECVSEDEV